MHAVGGESPTLQQLGRDLHQDAYGDKAGLAAEHTLFLRHVGANACMVAAPGTSRLHVRLQ